VLEITGEEVAGSVRVSRCLEGSRAGCAMACLGREAAQGQAVAEIAVIMRKVFIFTH
jgi:hypothetical protein